MKTLSLPLSRIAMGASLGFLLPLAGLQAQTADQEVSLSEGWNSIWLEVEPIYAGGDTVLNDPAIPGDDETIASGDDRIGLPKAPQDIFTNPAISTIATPKPLAGLAEFFGSDPGSISTFNQDEWQTWLRADPSGSSNLPLVPGNRPYLVKVDPGTSTFALTINGEASFFRPTWIPDRYNLLGFGINGTISFEDFFTPSGNLHQANRIYMLASDGNWSIVNPADPMGDGLAYWIFCNGASDYMGPVAVDFPQANLGELNFGGPGDAGQVDVDDDALILDLEELVFTNLAGSNAVPELRLVTPSEGSGSLDLHVVSPATDSLSYVRGNQVDSTAGDATAAPLGETVGANSSTVLTLGALRNWTSGEVSRTNLYRLITGNPGTKVYLPISALNNEIQLPTDLLPGSEAGNLAGLWVGDVIIDRVTSIVEDGAPVRPAAGSAPIRLILHSNAAGAVSLLSQVTVMQTKTADPEVSATPVLVVNPKRIPFYEGVKERNGKRVGIRIEAVAFDMQRKLDATSQDALLNDPAYPDLTEEGISDFITGRNTRPPSLAEAYELTRSMNGAIGAGKTVQTSLNVDPFHRSNPFRHAYHQQHGRGPNITRTIEIVFDASQPVAGRLTGTFREIMQGPIKSDLELTGRLSMSRISGVTTLDTDQ